MTAKSQFISLSTLFVAFGIATGCGDSSNAVPAQPGATPVANPTSAPVATPGVMSVAVSIPSGATGKGPAAYGTNPLQISSGATVTWTNNDSVPHTVTADDNSFDSGTLSPNQTFSHTFATAGSYPYHCTIHGAASMSGSIQVMGTGVPSPTPSASPSGIPSGTPSGMPSTMPGMSGNTGY